MENKLTGTSDIYTVCTNESILTIDDKEVGENIEPFVSICKITGQQCTVSPITLGDIASTFGGTPASGQGKSIWLNHAKPFADIDALILTEDSFFLCAVGSTKVEISDPAQYDVRVGDSHKINDSGLLFPSQTIPLNHPQGYEDYRYADWDYTTGDGTTAATFSYPRGRDSNGNVTRRHAAVDLYYDVGEPLYAMADGVVMETGSFYHGTDVISIEFDIELVPGHKMVVRYGEVAPGYTVSPGQVIEAGDYIADVGRLHDANGHSTVIQPPSDGTLPGHERGMLHLEVYTGEASYDNNGNFQTLYTRSGIHARRSDLYPDPELIVDAAFEALCIDKGRLDLIDRLKRINGVPEGKLVAVDGAVISCPNATPPPQGSGPS